MSAVEATSGKWHARPASGDDRVIIAATVAGLLQIAISGSTSAPSARELVVRRVGASDAKHVPLVARADGQLGVRADLLTQAIGGSTTHEPNGHFRVELPGATLDVADQSGFATASNGIVPLPAPAWVERGALYLPLAVVSDMIPRVATGVLYDPAKGELRLFAPLRGGKGHTLAATRRSSALSEQPGAFRDRRGAEAERTGVSPEGDVLVGANDPPEASLAEHRHLVVVDAGHGGPDHGMIGPIGSTHPFYEKDITLAVALKVGGALRKRGIDVMETRTTDTLIALSDRGRIANAHHGDLFLSIHVNAANPNWHDPAAARGFETYFLAEAKTEDARRVEQMENAAVRFETGTGASTNDPLNFIINDMAQNQHLRESSELAAIIQRHLGEIHPGPDRGVKQAGFVVLVTAYMPAVLVEIGFGTNPADARFLTDPAAQNRIANSIAAATADYLARYERRVSTASQ